MPGLMLFTDASLDTKTGIGYGAFLAANDILMSLAALKEKVKVKQFDNTTSTKLELQALLWACAELNAVKTISVIVYTDSQNILGLPGRRSELERKDYCAASGRRLHNAELYQAFYQMTDARDCQFIKVAGHKPQTQKSDLDKVFALVDKAARSALRNFNRSVTG